METKKAPENIENEKLFFCENCDLTYKTRAGLWKHKQKCTFINEEEETNSGGIDKEILLQINYYIFYCYFLKIKKLKKQGTKASTKNKKGQE